MFEDWKQDVKEKMPLQKNIGPRNPTTPLGHYNE